jgi:hypothetical protein
VHARLALVAWRSACALAAACIASLTAGCASPVLVALNESWFECSHARECEILEDPACRRIPINKHYAKPFAQHVRVDMPRRVATGPCPPPQARYRAVCEDRRCTSELRGLIRRRGSPAAEPPAGGTPAPPPITMPGR